MDSNTIRIGLFLIILIWSVISGITYMVRRSGNKSALRELKQEGQPLRRLSAEEQALVQPFLVYPANPKKTAQLLGDGVFPLRGAFVRHGLESGQGTATLHDTLGGVDVVLPYDARDYLREDNQAEVVMTEKFAIVVALNGEYDLAGGRERDARRQKQNQQWTGGKQGAMQNVVDADAADPAHGAQAAREFDDATRVEILSQRDETPAEVAHRQSRGIAFWPGLLWLVAFVCIGVAGMGGGMTWLAAAAAPALLALWLTWRRPALGEPQKVNRVRGELNAIVLTNPANAQAVSTQLFLGDKLPISLPDHWRANLELPEDGRVDVDLRVEDYAVLRLGGNYSVDEEQRLYPKVYWGRHVTLALVGLIAGGVLASIMANAGASLQSDIAQTSAWLRGAQPRAYASAAALAQDLPVVGDMVALRGKGRCQFQPDEYRPDALRFDCERLRWQGDAAPADELHADPAVLQLYSGNFLKTRPNPMMDMLVRSQIYNSMAGNPLAAYNARNMSAVTITRLTNTVLTVEQACEAATGQAIADCDRVKAELADKLMLAKDEPGNWLELLKLAQDGAFKRQGNADEGVLLSRHVDQVRDLAKSSMQPVLQAAIDQSARAIMASQRGGVVLQVWPGRYAELPELLDGAQRQDLLLAWQRQVAMMSADGAMPFEVAGMVTAVEHEASGTPVIAVDARRSLDDPWPALARVLWLALAVLLVAVHLPLALARWRAAAARRRNLAEYASHRSAAKPGFF
ncbi:IgaA/UmoB family intracellular growth attenuator [Achromobacter sp. UMC71]|uniref:IgaA/UmoB family intracellular growth attenuator n=1 Tax=Achromobacter sp. UMC71 TaxID=1862320 RepID=UPI001602BAEC|nr:IgaA/UmoB family intracellular growth attenuator [Achromobacter sp. UMC71]MBB1626646.1 intracellular growth attenuator igaA [Achromobacter sp. UMC71]